MTDTSQKTDLADWSATELIHGYRSGTISPLEATEASLDRIDRHHDRLNAFVMVDRDGALAAAKASEHGYKHSAMIHTMNVARMTHMARAMDTTIFVKNGPCVAGLGLGGEGYISFSIATTTGEGITTPRTFTRFRRCTLVDNLNII